MNVLVEIVLVLGAICLVFFILILILIGILVNDIRKVVKNIDNAANQINLGTLKVITRVINFLRKDR